MFDIDFMTPTPHHAVIVFGAGQAGLACSYWLKQAGIAHLVLEKRRVGSAWADQRWDSFCLVTPNWQCKLPGFHYDGAEFGGDDPDGFMPKDQIVRYLEAYRSHIGAPVKEGVAVTRLTHDGRRFRLSTSKGAAYTADHVIVAAGGYHEPRIPADAATLPGGLFQVHSSQYRNPDQMPAGAVLVVGSGQSGCQIAEDLHLAGRQVHLSLGSAPRSPRRYRGRDATDWLADMGQYDQPIEEHPLGKEVRFKANHYLTGRDGGREIDLRQRAVEGMVLYGRMTGSKDGVITFAEDLAPKLIAADTSYDKIRGMIDAHIRINRITAPTEPLYSPPWRPMKAPLSLDPVAAGLSAIVWCTGFKTNFGWIDLPIFNGAGYPEHTRGVSPQDGLYFVGMPWLHTWGSGRFWGVGEDARFLVDRIAAKDRAALGAAA